MARSARPRVLQGNWVEELLADDYARNSVEIEQEQERQRFVSVNRAEFSRPADKGELPPRYVPLGHRGREVTHYFGHGKMSEWNKTSFCTMNQLTMAEPTTAARFKPQNALEVPPDSGRRHELIDRKRAEWARQSDDAFSTTYRTLFTPAGASAASAASDDTAPEQPQHARHNAFAADAGSSDWYMKRHLRGN